MHALQASIGCWVFVHWELGGLHLFGLRFGGLGNVKDPGGCDDLVFGLLLESAGSPGIFGEQ